MRTTRITIRSLSALTGVAVIALILSRGSTGRPINLGLQNYAKGTAVVTVTNMSHREVDYVWTVERKTADGWPKYEDGIPLGVDSSHSGRLEPRQVVELALPVMVYAPPCPWRVSVFCYKNPAAPNTGRDKAGFWFTVHGMPWLGRKVTGDFKVVQVSGPEMEQKER